MKRSLSLLEEKLPIPMDIVEYIGKYIDPGDIGQLWCYANLCRKTANIAYTILSPWVRDNTPKLVDRIKKMFLSNEQIVEIHQFLLNVVDYGVSGQNLSKLLLVLYVIHGHDVLYRGEVYLLNRLDDSFAIDTYHREMGQCYWYSGANKHSIPLVEMNGIECNLLVIEGIDSILEKDLFNTYHIKDREVYLSKSQIGPPLASYPVASVIVDNEPLFLPTQKKFRTMVWVYGGRPEHFKRAMHLHQNMTSIRSHLGGLTKARGWNGYY